MKIWTLSEDTNDFEHFKTKLQTKHSLLGLCIKSKKKKEKIMQYGCWIMMLAEDKKLLFHLEKLISGLTTVKLYPIGDIIE